jgi:release factor glutamine methyltransferase
MLVSSLGKKPSKSPALFHYRGLAIELHPDVYDPAEDTFLLLDSLRIDPHDTILELGTGCGLIALECARRGAQVLCTDINPFAVRLTRCNIERNRSLLKGTIDIRQGNLFSVLKKDERFDVIIFNPPYLPTTTRDTVDKWFDIATDGGRNGLKTTQQFLHDLPKHLSSDGRSYFIFSSLSPRSTLERHLKKENLSAWIVASQRFESEELDVYCITPTA